MTDDERRAEIETVARALAGDDQGPWYAFEEDAEKVIAELDRVRDARGDDDLRDWLLRTVGVASSVPSAKRAIERLVADAIAESRVRDARGDDEGIPPRCTALEFGYSGAQCENVSVPGSHFCRKHGGAARSPQGEDHEDGGE